MLVRVADRWIDVFGHKLLGRFFCDFLWKEWRVGDKQDILEKNPRSCDEH